MDRKKLLVSVVWAFTLCGCGILAVVFLDAAFPDQRGHTTSKIVLDITDLALGEPRIVELSPSRPLIILRASRAQLENIAALDPHVWGSSIGEQLENHLFVFWALSTGKFGGCRLIHIPPAESNSLDSDDATHWLGGYWGAGCGASYDYAGRAIKNPRYAYSEYVDRSQSLRAARVVMVDKHHILLRLD